MSATDFAQWALADLVLTLGGRTYTVQPPTVEDAKKILASAALAEVRLGLAEGPLPDEVRQVLDTYGPGDHPALGTVHDQLVADGVDPWTIDRMGYYAVFYWAKGKEYADKLATILWAPRAPAEGEAGGAAPKGSSRPRTGRRTASENPTPTAGTRTTGRSPRSSARKR